MCKQYSAYVKSYKPLALYTNKKKNKGKIEEKN